MVPRRREGCEKAGGEGEGKVAGLFLWAAPRVREMKDSLIGAGVETCRTRTSYLGVLYSANINRVGVGKEITRCYFCGLSFTRKLALPISNAVLDRDI